MLRVYLFKSGYLLNMAPKRGFPWFAEKNSLEKKSATLRRNSTCLANGTGSAIEEERVWKHSGKTHKTLLWLPQVVHLHLLVRSGRSERTWTPDPSDPSDPRPSDPRPFRPQTLQTPDSLDPRPFRPQTLQTTDSSDLRPQTLRPFRSQTLQTLDPSDPRPQTLQTTYP